MELHDSIESLIRSAQNGDRTAFKALYDKYHHPVFRTAYRLLGNRMRAEDVTQEVFVAIYKKLDSFDFDAAFKTWCYRITINACYDIMRKQQRRGKYNKGPVDPSSFESKLESLKRTRPEEMLNRKELARLIDEKLQDMHKDMRTTFVLREIEQLSYSDIAQVMDCSEGTVASRLARARSQLATYLTKLGIDHTYFN